MCYLLFRLCASEMGVTRGCVICRMVDNFYPRSTVPRFLAVGLQIYASVMLTRCITESVLLTFVCAKYVHSVVIEIALKGLKTVGCSDICQ